MPLRTKLCSVIVPVLVALLAAGCSDDDSTELVLPFVMVTTHENVPARLNVLANAKAPDLTMLRVTTATAPAPHRVEILDTGVIQVTPGTDFLGDIEVIYRVSDGPEHTGIAAARVTVVP
jgi:hypothetical protein